MELSSFKSLPSINSLGRIPKIIRSAESAIEVTKLVDTVKKMKSNRSNVGFGKLVMKELKYIPVPNEIQKIEHEDDTAGLSDYHILYAEATNTNEYVAKFENLIHFEEAANSKVLRDFYLCNVVLIMISQEQQTFEIKCHQNLTKWIKGFKEKKIDAFELKPVSYFTEGLIITGKVKKVDAHKMIIQIVEGFTLLKSIIKLKKIVGSKIIESEDSRLFDIEFQVNRSPFLLQHNALIWFEKHNLFDVLIDHPNYEIFPNEFADVASTDNDKFR